MEYNKSNRKPRTLELLAPARNAEIAIAAIDHGADAVYIGATHHGARHAAGNSLNDIKRVIDYAHLFDARVYVTLNTIIYDNELEEVESLAKDLYHIGVDALIVQDMALTEMKLPPIPLHASTQCDIRTPQRARFLQDAGMSQLVLARELTLDEIKAIREETTVPLEAFVHGALCVSYSGNCQASQVITHRSANRGECAQICRLSYNLIDGNGHAIISDRHLLSLRDMNRIDSLSEMIDAGIDSFKIEGRLKDLDYVKIVVSAYSEQLDKIINSRGDGSLRRRSRGQISRSFEAKLDDSFNRGYTDYFLHQRRPASKMASIETPKNIGKSIGRVKKVLGNTLLIETETLLTNGDGLTFFNRQGKLQGFRVNRVDQYNKIQLTSAIDIKPGTELFRNHDIKRESMMARTTSRRVIDVVMNLRFIDNDTRVALDISLSKESQIEATVTAPLPQPEQKAKQPQKEVRKRTLSKLGETNYNLVQLNDLVEESSFIPLSLLTALKRKATELLDQTLLIRHQVEPRKPLSVKPLLNNDKLNYTDNVANKLSKQFYLKAGAKEIEPAIECQNDCKIGRRRVMLTRYCIRRELGYCLKTQRGKQLKSPLKLQGSNFEMDVEFDCSRCEMALYTCR